MMKVQGSWKQLYLWAAHSPANSIIVYMWYARAALWWMGLHIAEFKIEFYFTHIYVLKPFWVVQSVLCSFNH